MLSPAALAVSLLASGAYQAVLIPDESIITDQTRRLVYVVDGSGARDLTIRQADPEGMTLTPIKGQTSPVMQGWTSGTYAFKQPAWALEFTRNAANALFTTLLAAGPYAAQTSTVVTTQVTGGERADLCVGGTTGYTVFVPADPAAATTIAAGARIGQSRRQERPVGSFRTRWAGGRSRRGTCWRGRSRCRPVGLPGC